MSGITEPASSGGFDVTATNQRMYKVTLNGTTPVSVERASIRCSEAIILPARTSIVGAKGEVTITPQAQVGFSVVSDQATDTGVVMCFVASDGLWDEEVGGGN